MNRIISNENFNTSGTSTSPRTPISNASQSVELFQGIPLHTATPRSAPIPVLQVGELPDEINSAQSTCFNTPVEVPIEHPTDINILDNARTKLLNTINKVQTLAESLRVVKDFFKESLMFRHGFIGSNAQHMEQRNIMCGHYTEVRGALVHDLNYYKNLLLAEIVAEYDKLAISYTC